MAPMTPFERMTNALRRQPVDEVPVGVGPWKETVARWTKEGRLRPDEDFYTHFGQSYRWSIFVQSVANLDVPTRTIWEDAETYIELDGNGAQYRRHKLHESTPEHVAFAVQNRVGWEEAIKPHLLRCDRRRIKVEEYRKMKTFCREHNLFFLCGQHGPFELMQMMCGHENLLMGMGLDPDWVRDMVDTYVRMTMTHLDVLFAEEGRPDGMFIFDDLGFKQKPFFSPAMYDDIMAAGHQRLFDFAHAHQCKVLVHSCGYIVPLVPGLIRAGMDCLQAMEVKAGMDMMELFKVYGTKIAFFGGMDVRILIGNDRAAVEAELQRKLVPILRQGGGYVLHSDHSEPPDVNYDTMRYFIDRGRELSRAVRAGS